MSTRTAFGGMIVLTTILSGCGQEPQEPVLPAPTTIPQDVAIMQDTGLGKDWLKPEDNVDPARWMAEKEAANDPTYDKEAAATQIRQLLDSANKNFMESARMIANRAVQLEDTLKSKGINERARDIIATLNSIEDPSIQSRRFGALCQYYATLRMQGMSSENAIKTLSKNQASQLQ